MADLFTSDTHFYHRNIIEYCDRPFRTLDGQPDFLAMNEELVRRWNARVKPEDTVYHLGDFGFGRDCTPERLSEIRKRLNGRMVLIRGNHDHKPSKWIDHRRGDQIFDEMVYMDKIYMCHVPPGDVPEGRHINGKEIDPISVVFCGHVHETFGEMHLTATRYKDGSLPETHEFQAINVGVDVRDFAPVTLDDLKITL